MKYHDFRSDTVTHPTEAMRAAMATAPVGDDVYEEDPTVIALEQKSASLLGKEAALYVTSGTMGNLVAVMSACERGDEAIMGSQAHTFLHEAGGVSVAGSVVIHTIPNQPDGTLDLADLAGALRYPDDVHAPVSRMVILENTQNACGGMALTPAYTARVARFAHENDLHLHIDGARIFNAAVALGVPALELAREADSVTFCLSKGLCAPVGSVLCGSADFIHRARRLRKMLGGGMRQAGIIAAAGIVALEGMIDRLAEDHRRARVLAEGLAKIPGLTLTKGSPHTNMIFVKFDDEARFTYEQVIDFMKARGVLINDSGPGEYRLVTHNDIDDDGVAACMSAFSELLAA